MIWDIFEPEMETKSMSTYQDANLQQNMQRAVHFIWRLLLCSQAVYYRRFRNFDYDAPDYTVPYRRRQ
jgi:hypothetical protein